MEIPYILRQLGFDDKETRVYLALLNCGTASDRRLADETELSKHIVTDALKVLQSAGLVSTYQKHKKTFFVAEDPEKLSDLVSRREHDLLDIRRRINEQLPELKIIYAHGGIKPALKFYEGMKGVEIILKDVLSTMTASSGYKQYRVFASPRLRQFIFDNFSGFTKERIAHEIHARVLVLGEERPDRPLMEQKVIPVKEDAPTYGFIYGSKVAFISLDKNDLPTGVILEDERIARTQQIIFDHIWNSSAEKRRLPVEATIAANL